MQFLREIAPKKPPISGILLENNPGGRGNYGFADELSIIGFGGLSPAKYSAVPLTTVEQPFEQIGFEAARMLLEHITTQKVIDGRNIILQNSLALADSCAMPSAMQHHKKNNRKGKEFS